MAHLPLQSSKMKALLYSYCPETQPVLTAAYGRTFCVPLQCDFGSISMCHGQINARAVLSL